jgi:NADH-quinone oxidoreductase subunit K
MEITLNHYLLLSAVLFIIGILGVMLRRNALVIFMSVELMLNAVNLTFIAFANYLYSKPGSVVISSEGQIFVFFIMAVAAAEVAVGLAIIIALHRNKDTINIDEANTMRG